MGSSPQNSVPPEVRERAAATWGSLRWFLVLVLLASASLVVLALAAAFRTYGLPGVFVSVVLACVAGFALARKLLSY